VVKAIGFLVGVGTSLTAVMLWFSTSTTPRETVSDAIAPNNASSHERTQRGEIRVHRAATLNNGGGQAGHGSAAEEPLAAPLDPISRGSEPNPSNKAAARRLLYQARRLAMKGEIGAARNLARRARTFSVDWSANEQSPHDFLNDLKDLQRLLESGRLLSAREAKPVLHCQRVELGNSEETEGRSSEPELATEPADDGFHMPILWPTAKEQAARLLEQARADLNAGRSHLARAKATRADAMNVTYTLFDDRPALILKEIDELAANLSQKRIPLSDELDNHPPATASLGRRPQPSPTPKTSKWRSRARVIAVRRGQETIQPCSGTAEGSDGS